MRKRATVIIRTNTIDDFDIIDWEVAEGYDITKDDIKGDNVGKFMSDMIRRSNSADEWGVNTHTYEFSQLKSGIFKHSFNIDFWGDEDSFENPLHLFGLDGECRAKWL